MQAMVYSALYLSILYYMNNILR